MMSLQSLIATGTNALKADQAVPVVDQNEW
jgi:hypothetical protein